MSKFLHRARSKALSPRRAHSVTARSERGAITAEYAAVTAAGAGFVGVLISVLTSDWGQQLVTSLINWGLSQVGIHF